MDSIAKAIGEAAETLRRHTACAVQVLESDLAVLKKYSELMGWTTDSEDYKAMLDEIASGFEARCAGIEKAYNAVVMPALAAVNGQLDGMVVFKPLAC